MLRTQFGTAPIRLGAPSSGKHAAAMAQKHHARNNLPIQLSALPVSFWFAISWFTSLN
jgi:hypothetical protein